LTLACFIPQIVTIRREKFKQNVLSFNLSSCVTVSTLDSLEYSIRRAHLHISWIITLVLVVLRTPWEEWNFHSYCYWKDIVCVCSENHKVKTLSWLNINVFCLFRPSTRVIYKAAYRICIFSTQCFIVVILHLASLR
jgi:hypothetical protein